MTDPKLPAHIQALVDEYREPLGLDRWSLRLEVGPMPPEDTAKAACTASPEYREATILFDLERLATGDEVEELVAHECSHPLLWPIHEEAESLAEALALTLPEASQKAMRMHLEEGVRKAAERSATDYGQVILRYHRRLRNANAEIATLKKELREARKKAPGAERGD